MKKLLLIMTAVIVMACEKTEIQLKKEPSKYEIIAYSPVHYNFYKFISNQKDGVKDEKNSELTKITHQRVHRTETYNPGTSVTTGLISLGSGGAFVKLEVKKDGETIFIDSAYHQLTYSFFVD